MASFEALKNKFLERWNRMVRRPDDDGMADVGREKVAVFVVAFVLALCLWLMVELSREYTLTVNMPVEVGNVAADRALAEELPNFVIVSVSGEGWRLIDIYNNPGRVYVDVTENEINLYDQISQQMTRPDLTVEKVQPITLSLDIEERVTKKVPVTPRVNVQFRERFGLTGEASMTPDSVDVSGAASIIDTVRSWPTRQVSLTGINSDINRELELADPGNLLSLGRSAVQYQAEVSEYTESEVRVPITTLNMPSGRTVNYSPSALTVRYDIPIEQYRQVEGQVPFSAYVTFEQIQSDSTGYVTPELEISAKDLNIRLRSHQPNEVAYFIVINN